MTQMNYLQKRKTHTGNKHGSQRGKVEEGVGWGVWE